MVPPIRLIRRRRTATNPVHSRAVMNAASSRHAREAMLRGGGNRPRSLPADRAGFMTMAIARGRCVLEMADLAGSPVRGIRGVPATRTVRATEIVPGVQTISPVRGIRGVPATRTVRTTEIVPAVQIWAVVRLRGIIAMETPMATAVLMCAQVEGGARSRGGFRRLIALRYHTDARRASGTAASIISATG